MNPWQIRVLDPSGETRIIPLTLEKPTRLGRLPTDDLTLKDPTLPWEVAEISPLPEFVADHEGSPFWIQIHPTAKAAWIGNWKVREAALPVGIPLQLGESSLTLESAVPIAHLPTTPSQQKAWLTCSESGAELLWMTKKAASTPLSIYIAGETGTGKEVIAGLIHAWSERASGPFVPLHCGALAPSLAESELFGHIKGAYTGASHHRTGAFLKAHNGTLFLDEIGDLSMELQVKLLRFLENGEIRAVGSDSVSHADVRIICATHLPLKKLVEEGKFRRDLYYRLASVTLEIPTLRSRPEDIEMLSQRFAKELGKCISPKTLTRIKAHPWPGNVRELRHAIERAAGLSGPFQSILDDSSFEFLIRPETVTENPDLELGASTLTLHEMERAMILKSLRLCHGNRADAAKMLGIARSTLFEMLRRHGIQGPRAELARVRSERARKTNTLTASS